MIEVEGLRFRYAGAGAEAVRGLDFAVARGEVFGFLGPSGAGKSTTQKLLVGLLAGYSGKVRVLGTEAAQWQPDHYQRIGVSFETPNHFQRLTGRENLRYFAALSDRPTRAVATLLASVGLEGDGDKTVGHYSRGMQVRLGIARALLCDPELLFLDEPTAGLDPVNVDRVSALIAAERAAGRTVFLTTHDMAAAEALCDRVAFIVDGAIACIDSPRALKLAHGQRTVRVEYRQDGQDRSRDFALDGLGDDAAFQALLRTGTMQTVHSREARLADVFIRVTGKALA